MTKIITHPGSAHVDDLLSTCLVISKDSRVEKVERRAPTEEELNDPHVWVLDIGNRCDPELHDFDHHQEVMDDCTLSLLLKSWNLWDETSMIFPWLPITVLYDSKGPFTVQKMLNIDRIAEEGLESFVEEVVLSLFQEKASIKKDSFLFTLLKKIGDRFFRQLEEYNSTLLKVKQLMQFTKIKGVPVVSCRGIKKNDILLKIVGRLKREKWGKGGLVIYENDRPEGTLVLKRYDDDNRIDFTRISNEKKVLFCHKNGFLVAIESIPESKIAEYISKSIK